MSTYHIHGLETDWKGIPYSEIDLYGPTERTYIYLWRASDPDSALFIHGMLNMLARIGEISRRHYLDLGDSRCGLLFDYMAISPSTQWTLDALAAYSRILCGSNYYLSCPYNEARTRQHRATLDYATDTFKAITYAHKVHGTSIPDHDPNVTTINEYATEAAKHID